jgi:hypothetical protein
LSSFWADVDGQNKASEILEEAHHDITASKNVIIKIFYVLTRAKIAAVQNFDTK